MEVYNRIIISRTDSIGDVILTLPVAGLLKRKLPDCEIIFMGRSYTHDVIMACEHIDRFLNWDDLRSGNESDAIRALQDIRADLIIHVFPRREISSLAKKAGIPARLGTTNRLYHWYSCNKLVRLSRKKSELHEAQLNLKLVESITGERNIAKNDIPTLYGLTRTESLSSEFLHLSDTPGNKIVLHPKSKGSAREWGIDNFIKLIDILPEEKFKIFISGTKEEGELIRNSGIFDADHVIDLTGKMSLQQLMSFIKSCDCLIAASTGPLHLAAALGTCAIGIYPPIKPMHPGRWAPIGEKAEFLVKEKKCNDCRKQGPCHCMQDIRPEDVKKQILRISH
ncbi:MAG: glycosyltransferase family 9 protein [Bacteroidota bacterium]